jgi:4-hydroxy-2-oxoheptanedioate aldolase
MRTTDGKPPSGESTIQVMKRILDACRRNKVAPGLHTGSADEARLRIEEGWQFIAVASELRMMLNAAEEVVREVGLGKETGELAKY